MDPDFGDLALLRRRMLVWATTLLRNRTNAEDLVQATFLQMLTYRSKFDPALGGVDQWVRTVMLNLFRGRYRRGRDRNELIDGFPSGLLANVAAPDNPETAVYCRQVCRMALGLDAAMLLAEPSSPETPTERTRRRRARLQLTEMAT